jgi:prepilin-type N-terminal cleavage/methylation domain-containing protein
MHSMNFKFSKGFTLIELIIVLSIVSLLLSVVAPISIKAVDKTEAKTELLNTTKWIKNIGFQAFIKQQSYSLELYGNTLNLYKTPSNELVKTKELASLNFTQQRVDFNANGLVTPAQISGHFRGEPLTISLEPNSEKQ